MCNQDVKPNYVSFGILIKAYGIKGDLNKCMEIFDS
jgi:pentatricopeptide repeat protein